MATSDERVQTLREGLERLATPNWSVRATGKDAVDMVNFARQVLDADKLDADEQSDGR